jgi:hypothetical protein
MVNAYIFGGFCLKWRVVRDCRSLRPGKIVPAYEPTLFGYGVFIFNKVYGVGLEELSLKCFGNKVILFLLTA